MLQINPKKFKNIENKSIPSPLRPKFRNKALFLNLGLKGDGIDLFSIFLNFLGLICNISLLTPFLKSYQQILQFKSASILLMIIIRSLL